MEDVVGEDTGPRGKGFSMIENIPTTEAGNGALAATNGNIQYGLFDKASDEGRNNKLGMQYAVCHSRCSKCYNRRN